MLRVSRAQSTMVFRCAPSAKARLTRLFIQTSRTFGTVRRRMLAKRIEQRPSHVHGFIAIADRQWDNLRKLLSDRRFDPRNMEGVAFDKTVHPYFHDAVVQDGLEAIEILIEDGRIPIPSKWALNQVCTDGGEFEQIKFWLAPERFDGSLDHRGTLDIVRQVPRKTGFGSGDRLECLEYMLGTPAFRASITQDKDYLETPKLLEKRHIRLAAAVAGHPESLERLQKDREEKVPPPAQKVLLKAAFRHAVDTNNRGVMKKLLSDPRIELLSNKTEVLKKVTSTLRKEP